MSSLTRLQKNNEDLEEITTMAEELPNVDPDTTDATATENDIIAGKTAWVANEELTGNIDDLRSAEFISLINTSFDTTITPSGITLKGNPDILNESAAMANNSVFQTLLGYNRLALVIGARPELIKKGSTICDITGTYEGVISEEDLLTAEALLTEILS